MTHVMQVCDRSGHTTLTWTDEDVDAEFKRITSLFDQKVHKEGMFAYRTEEDGSGAEQIKTFDKTAPKIVLTPPLMGG